MRGNGIVMEHGIRAAGRIQSVTSCKTCKGADEEDSPGREMI
jgi:hypothetical protein